MSGLTEAQIQSDMANIFTDLASSGAVEEVSRIPAGETEIDGTFDVVRARQLESQELQASGFATLYRFSVYAQRADIGELTEGDVIVMADGNRLRVFRMSEQPARVIVRLELGDEFEDGEG